MSSEADRFGPQETTFSSPYEAKPEETRQGSGCMKFLVIGGILMVLSCAGCCVGGILLAINGVVQDPDKIERMADEMIAWEFNQDLTGRLGLDYFIGSMVALSEPDEGIVIMMQSRFIPDEQAAEDLNLRIRENMEFGADDEREVTDVIEGGERTISIRGRDVTLQFDKTRGRKTEKIYWEIAGIVPGESGPVILFMQMLDEAWNDEAIEERLRSIGQ